MPEETAKIIDGNSDLLKPFLIEDCKENFIETLKAFIKQQTASWPQLRTALQNLDDQLLKDVFLSELTVQLHHNSRRIKSSAAKVDNKSISERACFLCPDKLYKKQLGLSYQDSWLILNNPFPIFKDHLVVSHKDHLMQDINDALPAMINFVRDTDFSFSTFYNGPACGASAPDHLHFQACKKNDLPIVGQLEKIFSKDPSQVRIIDRNSSITSYTETLDNRGIFVCISEKKETLLSRLLQVLSYLKSLTNSPEEPLINIIISGKENTFNAILFPRKAHRPECFFREDSGKFLISPGAVDVAGSVILPLKADYDRIDKGLLLNIFSEVCFDHSVFQNLSFQGM